MHHAAASVYARTAKITQSPRDLEASLLLKAAHRLQALGEDRVENYRELGAALTFNRRIWTVLASSAASEAHPLPAPIKANIASLAAFIFQRTLSILAEPSPEKLGILIRINREIAGGLRGSTAGAGSAVAG